MVAVSMAKSRDYWRARFEALEEAQFQKTESYFKDIEKAYKQAMFEIEKDISRWYQRFADNNEISLAEAKRLLKTNEFEELKWTVEEYIKYGEENALNQQWMKQLENASSRVHISRLESLRLQLQQHVEKLYGGRIESFEKLMKEVYQEQYYQSVFQIQSAFEIGFAFQTLNDDVLTKVISKPWTLDGTTFSAKIWKDKNLLIDTLQKELVQSFARGESPQRMIAVVKNRLDVSRANAARLVQTEASFFGASAQRDAFKALDVDQYEIVATLDSRTSSICRSMDGKVFLMADFETGVTANPFHPRCRTTTAPYFEDDDGERIARAANGQTYTIPSNMKYEQWKKQYVDDSTPIKVRNEYAKYQEILGENLPYSLAEFVNVKYNSGNDWSQFKAYASSIKTGELTPHADFELYKKISTKIDNDLIGKVTANGITLTDKSNHYIARTIGSVEQRRNGVSIERALKALQQPLEIYPIKTATNGRSQRFRGDDCIVTVNPDSGNLIQVNPYKNRVSKK